MNTIDRFLLTPVASVRVFLFSRAFLLLLALDSAMLMIGHAGRYGAGGFNVAHVAWVDAIQPLPTPELYVGMLLLCSLLSATLAFTGLGRGPMLLLFGLYTYSWTMSMLDSYQHHYFLSLVLLCMVFFPNPGADQLHRRSKADPWPMSVGMGVPLLGVTIAILYFYAAAAKVEENWMTGFTMRQLSEADVMYAALMGKAVSMGMEAADFWALLATAVIPLEMLLGTLYLVAVQQDRSDRVGRLARRLAFAGFGLAMGLHVSAEMMGLEIGWFSYYMMMLALVWLLPVVVVDLLARVVTAPAVWLAAQLRAWAQEGDEGGAEPALLSMGVVAVLGAVGWMIDLPGAMGACAVASLGLVAMVIVHVRRKHGLHARQLIVGAAMAATVLWLAIANSQVRWDYYRYVGGDLRRRGQAEAALTAYLKGEQYAPEGQSRQKKIDELRQQLGR